MRQWTGYFMEETDHRSVTLNAQLDQLKGIFTGNGQTDIGDITIDGHIDTDGAVLFQMDYKDGASVTCTGLFEDGVMDGNCTLPIYGGPFEMRRTGNRRNTTSNGSRLGW